MEEEISKYASERMICSGGQVMDEVWKVSRRYGRACRPKTDPALPDVGRHLPSLSTTRSQDRRDRTKPGAGCIHSTGSLKPCREARPSTSSAASVYQNICHHYRIHDTAARVKTCHNPTSLQMLRRWRAKREIDSQGARAAASKHGDRRNVRILCQVIIGSWWPRKWGPRDDGFKQGQFRGVNLDTPIRSSAPSRELVCLLAGCRCLVKDLRGRC
ncbi:hypothetical protein MAPG_07378 [Magnaporthiopsis poae ATCC 64411]|uniref:Uncharacterized protein n=1 Tax=Magnaporthiopsis poae (strain ATCC 64411 / 73-15) TaxID=644358 RepID=A0A0C4E4I4_MAGP6|nr:hypothetical protein MAPG_07378 [Magnaporthiopsis poae ATCC 64411]